jgi:L-seryl-tRNA(Ser) seleniumtransferase
LAVAVGDGLSVTVTDCASQIGSGALPLETLPSAGLAIAPVGRKGAGTRIEALAAAFRSLPIPVIGRIKDGAFILDLRCLDDEAAFLAQLGRLDLQAAVREARDAPA